MPFSLDSLLDRVHPVDKTLAPAVRARLDNLTKPRGSLGRLEDVALKMALISGGEPVADPARVYTVAGDHGVAVEGVSLFPQEVTRQMVFNFLAGGAAINALAKAAGAELFVVDAGCAGEEFADHPMLIRGRVAPGTANLAREAAMTRQQCLDALALGASLADQAAQDGVRCLLTGEMGIANTTPATALYCAWLGLEPAAMTGPGTGLDADGVSHKARVIGSALELHRETIDSGDGLAVLAALGGLEIACLAGLVLGGAANRQLVLVDGFISTAAYLAASRLCPAVADYCLLSHASAEPGYKAAVEAMGQVPLLDLGMRLGEGTGAALALSVARAAAAFYTEMASFDQAGVSKD